MSFLYLGGFLETACYPNDACTCCQCMSLNSNQVVACLCSLPPRGSKKKWPCVLITPKPSYLHSLEGLNCLEHINNAYWWISLVSVLLKPLGDSRQNLLVALGTRTGASLSLTLSSPMFVLCGRQRSVVNSESNFPDSAKIYGMTASVHQSCPNSRPPDRCMTWWSRRWATHQSEVRQHSDTQ